MKKFVSLIIICMIVLGISCPNVKDNNNAKYHVKITNCIVEKSFYCDSYKKEGNTYILYDIKGEIIAEICKPEKYVIYIELNKEE